MIGFAVKNFAALSLGAIACAATLGMMSPSRVAVAAEPLVVRVKAPEAEGDVRDGFFRDMLSLALSKTAEAGPFVVVPGLPSNQARAIDNLKNGHLDVIWTIPTEEREREMLPVRIPLEKGLLGWRVFLIPDGTQKVFDKIRTLDDLKTVKFGQGRDWNSTKVLVAAGLDVVKVGTYDGLFAMTQQGKIDAFPRGLNEAWAELAARPNSGLVVESSILLKYKVTSYFFVAKDNKALATRLETGLRRALADGSFDALVISHPTHNAMLAQAGLERRRVIEIDNPTLPAATPLDQPELWSVKGLLDQGAQ